MAQYGPPSIAGTIDSTVDAIGGGIRDYRTGQALQNLPRTADGSIDYREAAVQMARVNPALSAQFLKMEELRGLQDYRQQSLGIQQQHVDIAKDKSQNIQAEGKIFHFGPNGQLKGYTDIETGVHTAAGAGGAPAPQQQPRPSPVNAGVGKQPSPDHLQKLQADPNLAPMFDEVYGPGSAQRYLAGGGPADPRQTPAAPAQPPPQPAPAPAPAPPPSTRPTSTAAPILKPPADLSYSQRQEWIKNRIKEQSSVDNPELKKSDDIIESGRTSLANLAEVVKLNKNAKEGPFAEQRAYVGALTGIGGKQSGVDTLVLQNKLTSGMLEQLRSTFGGNPTEGENKLLAKVTGSVSQPAAVRAEIFEDALRLVRRRIKFQQKYSNAQRMGQYMDPNYTDNTPVD